MVGIFIGLTGVMANTVGGIVFLRCELDDVDIVVSPVKPMATPSKEYAPTAAPFRSLEASTSALLNNKG